MVVQGVDLAGYPCIPATHALEFLAKAQTDLHLRPVKNHDAPALTVHTHRGISAHSVQSAQIRIVRCVAPAVEIVFLDQFSPPRYHAFTESPIPSIGSIDALFSLCLAPI